MSKRCHQAPARPIPIQFALFAEAASLARVCPEINEWRFYRLEVCPPLAIPSGSAGWNLEPASPNLFGRAMLMRQWGRIGSEGHRRLDPHLDAGAAQTAGAPCSVWNSWLGNFGRMGDGFV